MSRRRTHSQPAPAGSPPPYKGDRVLLLLAERGPLTSAELASALNGFALNQGAGREAVDVERARAWLATNSYIVKLDGGWDITTKGRTRCAELAPPATPGPGGVALADALAALATLPELLERVRELEAWREQSVGIGLTRDASPPDEYLTAEDAAELLKVTPGTIRGWCKAKKLPGVKLPGGDLRLKRSEVVRALDQGGEPANESSGVDEIISKARCGRGNRVRKGR